MDTHLVIVGGGLAGLTVAETLAKSKRFSKITILEQYENWGGRVLTIRKDNLTYEAGAGRIFHTHERVNALVKRFHLKTFPISTDSFLPNGEQNPFLDLFEPIRKLLSKCDQDTLATHTIWDLVPPQMRSIFQYYPYWAEIHDLRADLALVSFANTEPMGAKKPGAFYGIQGGMDQLTTNLQQRCKQAGVQLKARHTVNNIQRRTESLFEITGHQGKEKTPFTYQASHVVIATTRGSYDSFDVLKKSPLLKQLIMSPLIRVYAVYPPDKTTKKVWFSNHKFVVNNPLRYIIPINEDSGLIMISYTDGDDTKRWHTLKDQELEDAIQQELTHVFPDASIPKPTWLKKYDWPFGCSYFLPGNYSPTESLFEAPFGAPNGAQNPLPNLYICGESVSRHQGWMEGALESAERLIHHIKKSIV
jgi:protoporphyrinogen oxidase